MKDNVVQFLIIIGAIFATGLILETLGSGKLGSLPQTLAKKVTAGYGV